MKLERWIHGLTDLCLGLLLGGSIGSGIAVIAIFRVSRLEHFPKHIANTLAGSVFDWIMIPSLILGTLACMGCIFAALRPPERTRKRAWRVMAGLSVIMFALVVFSQAFLNPQMQRLRTESTWVDAELTNPDEKAAFDSAHRQSETAGLVIVLLAMGIIIGRRVCDHPKKFDPTATKT